jgi:hypothetical protein
LSGVAPSGSTEAGRYAVAVWRTILKYDPADSTGEIREALTFALMSNNELAEATTLANSVYDLRKNSVGFAYNFACLMSRNGNSEQSLSWLKCAIRMGFCDIELARRDPDLTFLRVQSRAKFVECTRVKGTWKLVYGIFNDDITFRNDSQFALTNVVIDVRLEQDDRRWAPKLKAELILPGQTKTWTNIVSIPDSRLTKSSATISCEQNR